MSHLFGGGGGGRMGGGAYGGGGGGGGALDEDDDYYADEAAFYEAAEGVAGATYHAPEAGVEYEQYGESYDEPYGEYQQYDAPPPYSYDGPPEQPSFAEAMFGGAARQRAMNQPRALGGDASAMSRADELLSRYSGSATGGPARPGRHTGRPASARGLRQRGRQDAPSGPSLSSSPSPPSSLSPSPSPRGRREGIASGAEGTSQSKEEAREDSGRTSTKRESARVRSSEAERQGTERTETQQSMGQQKQRRHARPRQPQQQHVRGEGRPAGQQAASAEADDAQRATDALHAMLSEQIVFHGRGFGESDGEGGADAAASAERATAELHAMLSGRAASDAIVASPPKSAPVAAVAAAKDPAMVEAEAATAALHAMLTSVGGPGESTQPIEEEIPDEVDDAARATAELHAMLGGNATPAAIMGAGANARTDVVDADDSSSGHTAELLGGGSIGGDAGHQAHVDDAVSENDGTVVESIPEESFREESVVSEPLSDRVGADDVETMSAFGSMLAMEPVFKVKDDSDNDGSAGGFAAVQRPIGGSGSASADDSLNSSFDSGRRSSACGSTFLEESVSDELSVRDGEFAGALNDRPEAETHSDGSDGENAFAFPVPPAAEATVVSSPLQDVPASPLMIGPGGAGGVPGITAARINAPELTDAPAQQREYHHHHQQQAPPLSPTAARRGSRTAAGARAETVHSSPHAGAGSAAGVDRAVQAGLLPTGATVDEWYHLLYDSGVGPYARASLHIPSFVSGGQDTLRAVSDSGASKGHPENISAAALRSGVRTNRTDDKSERARQRLAALVAAERDIIAQVSTDLLTMQLRSLRARHLRSVARVEQARALTAAI